MIIIIWTLSSVLFFYGIGKVFDSKEIVFHKIYQHMILPSLPMYTRDFFHGTCITSWLKKVKFLQQLIIVYCCYLKVISTSKLFFTMFYPLIYDQWIFLYEGKMFHSQNVEFHAFCKSTNFNFCGIIMSFAVLFDKIYTFDYFFRILGSIKIKLGQILLQLMANIFNSFLAPLWRLEISFKPFYGFDNVVLLYMQCVEF